VTSGILFVDKPSGMTSHDVVSRVRKLAGTRRVGHAGTLDPMATGLLVLGIEASTRLLTYLVGLDKQYLATIRLGRATTTDDAVGEAIGEPVDTVAISEDDISAAIVPLTGGISQVPSSVSAIKVDGRRAYDRVRAGEDVELAARRVVVSAFEVLETRRERIDGSEVLDLDVRVDCSSGTYIRALARDLGAGLGVGGHLTALRRTWVGPFTLDDAVALASASLADIRRPADVASRLFPAVSLTRAEGLELRQGKRPRLTLLDAELANSIGPIAAIDENGDLIGLVSTSDGVARVIVNFPEPTVGGRGVHDGGMNGGGSA
jgi:tRNA pseudouridine55 synthase